MTYPLHPLFVLGVGAPKCGTSYFERIFTQHPDISFSRVLESHFFSSNKYHQLGFDWYRTLFDQNKIPFDFSTKYLRHYKIVIPRLKSLSLTNDIRFICFLRDPVKRAYSNYLWLMQQSNKMPSYNLSIENFCSQFPQLIEYSQYEKGLSAFFRSFGRENFLIIQSEMFFMDPLSTVTKVEDFLCISNIDLYNLNYSKGSTYIPRFRLLEQARKKCFQLANSSGLFGIPLFRQYSTSLSSLYKALSSKSNVQLDPRKPEVIEYLANRLQPEYKALVALNLNIDFNLWNSSQLSK